MPQHFGNLREYDIEQKRRSLKSKEIDFRVNGQPQ